MTRMLPGPRRAILLFLVLFLLGATVAHGQVNPVNIQAKLESTPLLQGTHVRLAVKFIIDPAFHIQSAKPHDRYLIPAKITIQPLPGITAAPTRFPVPTEIKSPPAPNSPPSPSTREPPTPSSPSPSPLTPRSVPQPSK